MSNNDCKWNNLNVLHPNCKFLHHLTYIGFSAEQQLTTLYFFLSVKTNNEPLRHVKQQYKWLHVQKSLYDRVTKTWYVRPQQVERPRSG